MLVSQVEDRPCILGGKSRLATQSRCSQIPLRTERRYDIQVRMDRVRSVCSVFGVARRGSVSYFGATLSKHRPLLAIIWDLV